jgi:hypothetical protein
VVYVALTDDGRQVTLRPAKFAAKYGWKNDPEKIRLSSAAGSHLVPRKPSSACRAPGRARAPQGTTPR